MLSSTIFKSDLCTIAGVQDDLFKYSKVYVDTFKVIRASNDQVAKEMGVELISSYKSDIECS